MKKRTSKRPINRSIGGLIGLNALLVLCLIAVTFAPAVTAQQPATRGPGDYTMVGGQLRGQNADVVYIVDAMNQEMVAVMWNQSQRKMMAVGYRDLAADSLVTARPGR